MLYISLVENTKDKLLFEEIYNLHHRSAFNYAMNILHNHYDAEEATQNMWMAVVNRFNLLHIDDATDIKAYILRVTYSKSIDILRKKRKDKEMTADMDLTEIADTESLYDSLLYQACSELSYTIVVDCINAMDEIYSSTLSYYYLNGLKTNEIAKLMGIKEGTARVRLARGRALLLTKLTEK